MQHSRIRGCLRAPIVVLKNQLSLGCSRSIDLNRKPCEFVLYPKKKKGKQDEKVSKSVYGNSQWICRWEGLSRSSHEGNNWRKQLDRRLSSAATWGKSTTSPSLSRKYTLNPPWILSNICEITLFSCSLFPFLFGFFLLFFSLLRLICICSTH